MPIDSLSELASVGVPTITTEYGRTNIESDPGAGTRISQLSPRLNGSFSGIKPTAQAQVEDESRSDASETTLARLEQTITQDRPRLLWQAQRIVGRREIAEEIVQESLYKAFRALPRFRGESGMRTWLYAIVRNATIEHLRSHREPVQVSLEHFFNDDGDEMSMYDPPDSRNSPEDHYQTAEMQTILRDEVGRLGPCCRGAMQMCILEDNSYSDAAATFNVGVAKIKSRVYRAKRILSTRVRRRVGLA